MSTDQFIVTAAAQRPNRMDGTCFYCDQAIGKPHQSDCVLIQRRVKVRMTVEYEIAAPADWDKDMIESSRNHGSWCASNAINELEAHFAREDSGSCMCGHTNFEVVGDDGKPYLSED